MKNLATLRNSYNGIHQARHQWELAIIENLKEIGKEVKVLGDYYDPEDGWPEGLHIVIMDDDNYPQDIVIDSVKYEEKELSNIAVHLCYWDPSKCDQWWSISDFSSDDADTILLAIQWPESIKQGEAEEYDDIYIYFEESLYDYELISRHIAIYKTLEQAQKVFDEAVAKERAQAEENDWEIGTDHNKCFEAYPEGSWGTSHVTIEWHKAKVNELAGCYV